MTDSTNDVAAIRLNAAVAERGVRDALNSTHSAVDWMIQVIDDKYTGCNIAVNNFFEARESRYKQHKKIG